MFRAVSLDAGSLTGLPLLLLLCCAVENATFTSIQGRCLAGGSEVEIVKSCAGITETVKVGQYAMYK